MRTHRKIWITAAALLAAGAAICGISFAAGGFDVQFLNSAHFVTNAHEVSEPFQNISIQCDTGDVLFAASEDGICRVTCFEDEKEPHQVRVDSGTLTIDRPESRRYRIGLFLDSPKITVALPETAYETLQIRTDTGEAVIPDLFSFSQIDAEADTGSVSLAASASGAVTVQTETGDIEIHDMTAGSIALSSDTGQILVRNTSCTGMVETGTDTGDIELSDVTCTDFTSTGSTGDLHLQNVLASGAFHILGDTGDVRFEQCDAGTITVKTDTGNVKGTLLTEKIFLTKTDTGRVNVPKTVSGGQCDITTDTGDIDIRVP